MHLVHITPEMLGNVWDQVKPGLERIQRKTQEPWKLDDIFTALLAGRADLYIPVHKKHYGGFIITHPMVEPWSQRKILHIWCAYTLHSAVRDETIKTIAEIAKKAGYTALEFRSPRKGWEKRAATLGFKVKETTYQRLL